MAKIYNMDHAKRGIALVINIKTYDSNPFELDERKWSEKDVENLKTTLEYLEFDLKFHENLKAKEIRDEIQKIAELDHTDSDCFFCVVMSHGEDDKIIASDSKEISLNEIMEPIKSSCKSLENKPKLFFFQACRGDNEIKAKNDRPDSGVSTSSRNELTDHIDEKTKNKMHMPKQSPKKTEYVQKQRTYFIETESDLLVYYSTIEGQVSSGNVSGGTIFIKNVCEEFKKAYKNLPNNISLDAMIKNINRSVKESEIQLAETLDRFSGTVYFKPKDVSTFFYFNMYIFLNISQYFPYNGSGLY
jgi:hypothetical protein